jgi:hypothetical protein
MAFGAALLISPTRLAPLTALNKLTSDWNNIVTLVKHNLALSIAALVFIIMIDLMAFRHTLGRLSLFAITLTLMSVALLLP